MRRLYGLLWRDLHGVDRMQRLLVATFIAVAGAAVAYGLTAEDDRPTTAATTGAATAAVKTVTAPSVPRCRDAAREARRVTCRTATMTVTLAGRGVPVLLDGTQVRVLRATGAGRRVTVRARFRNGTRTARRINADGRSVYLSIGGRRVYADPLRGTSIAPDEGRTVDLRIALPARAERQLRAASGRAELAVVPWSTGRAGPKQLAIVRLTIPLRAAGASRAGSDPPP